MKAEDLKFLLGMARSPVRNYIVPGLTSSIIGAPHEGGCVRLFSSAREQQDVITPHSHRFDLLCMVLKGQVKNRLWMHVKGSEQGDLFVETKLHCNTLGSYRRGETQNVQRRFYDTTFKAGDTYSMKAAEIHSIYFGAGAEVLFFEGPQVTETSVILEPLVDGEHIKTFDVKPWMFQKGVE